MPRTRSRISQRISLILTIFVGITAYATSVASVERPRTGVQWGGYPIANYSSDLGLMTGLLTRRFDYGSGARPFDELITAQITYATLGPKDALLEYEKTGIGKYGLRLKTRLYYSHNQHQRYYGLGPDSQNNAA